MGRTSVIPNCSTLIAYILLISISVLLHITDAQVGVCYGTLGDNLPPPSEVIALANQNNIQRIRIYNPNPSILEALRGSPISVIVGVPNEEIQGIASDPSVAESWVRKNILNYNDVNFRYIAVGNEISPLDNASASIAPYVAPAMHNIYDVIDTHFLDGKIKVSTALSTGLLGQSYPPSAGEFRPEVNLFLGEIVTFLLNFDAPFLLNMYTYFPYVNQSPPGSISLDYATFTSSSPVVIDGQYSYQNLFDAILDATYVALEKGGLFEHDLEIVVTETGWPSAGSSDATVEVARIYNTNLVRHVSGGTPRRPGKPIEAYIFDFIDEDLKSPELEKHWGLFDSNKQLKYPITIP